MAELKKTEAAPPAGNATSWLPESLYPDDGKTLARRPPAGAITSSDEINPTEIWLSAFGDDAQRFGEAGRGRRLYFRLEEHVLSLRAFLGRELAREMAKASGFNFLPVAMAAGIALFYAAPAEPSLWALMVTTGVLLIVAGLVKFRRAGKGGLAAPLLWAFIAVSFGMLLAAAELQRRAMAVPQADVTAHVRGIVLASDLTRRGAARYLIKPLTIEGFSPAELPGRIRISGGKSSPGDATGSVVSGLARLRPLPAPLYPGGYDFAYHGWLNGLGMTGFFMGVPMLETALPAVPGWRERAVIFQNRVREKTAARIRTGLEGQAGHVAVALITGDRSGLSEPTQESLRRTGLAHILAISGLHMALVALTVIWLVRQCLLFVPGLAERHAIKKWAIGAGFGAATLYLFLAGTSVATQRAWIMLSVMMLAAMLDRQAITMRSVAIAALIVLAIAPSSLFQPGFQMSFAAVAALVAAYRQWTDWQNDAERHRQVPGALGRLGGYFAGLATTSLIAGAATALFAAWHFHRIAPLGMVANLLAMPLVSLAVMPLCLIAVLLMPYGLEALALKPLGWAIDGVLAIAGQVAAYHPGYETGLLSPQLPLLGALALVLLCGLQSRLRIAAIVPIGWMAALAWGGTNAPAVPALLLAQNGRTIAVRQPAMETAAGKDDAGATTLSLLNPGRDRFVTEIWRRAYLPNGSFSDFAALVPCGKDLCRFTAAGKRVSLVYDPDLLAKECSRADILLAPRLWFVRCKMRQPELTITRGDLELSGSHAVFVESGGIRTVSSWPSSGEVDAGTRRFSWQQRFDNVSRRFADRTGS